ncbi:retropepsin-like aspartic protease family protein [Undibacterium sp. SXout7W]|uniref:retropepsin-like aspartic protease family protein n=1 Tax=Undibacterium sp. SXout7W TaxID=3413049 RepID=UPI003BEFA5EC
MLKKIALLCAPLCMFHVHATDIGVVGLFPGKAILVVDGAPPKTYSIGSTISSDSKLIDADRESATILSNGKKQVLTMGQTVHRSAAGSGNSIVLQADPRGHFFVKCNINGSESTVNMLVDTGASFIALPAADAQRLGINYKSGKVGYSRTANGIVASYLTKLDTVKIGDLELHQIEAAIQETGLTQPLLGMSVLNRLEMRREGDQMTLTKRY